MGLRIGNPADTLKSLERTRNRQQLCSDAKNSLKLQEQLKSEENIGLQLKTCSLQSDLSSQRLIKLSSYAATVQANAAKKKPKNRYN